VFESVLKVTPRRLMILNGNLSWYWTDRNDQNFEWVLNPWHHMERLYLYRIDNKIEEFNNIWISFQAVEVEKKSQESELVVCA